MPLKALTKCSVRQTLRASHIKPWRLSNDQERPSGENELLLTATLDALFDSLLISFSDDGRMLFSPSLPVEERELLILQPDTGLWRSPSTKQKEYLEFHRDQSNQRYGRPPTPQAEHGLPSGHPTARWWLSSRRVFSPKTSGIGAMDLGQRQAINNHEQCRGRRCWRRCWRNLDGALHDDGGPLWTYGTCDDRPNSVCRGTRLVCAGATKNIVLLMSPGAVPPSHRPSKATLLRR